LPANVSDLEGGIYFLELNVAGKLNYIKFLKE
jgi:hypothetical protein